MALLERITGMQQSGMSDVQIMNTLRDEGVSPMEINEAISQSKIKAAVAPVAPAPEGEMQPSIMSSEENSSFMATPEPSSYSPAFQAPQEVSSPPQAYAPEAQAVPAPEQYPQEPYSQDQYAAYPDQASYAPESSTGYYQGNIDLETVRDIAQQTCEEAIRKMQEDVSSLSKIKTELKFEIQDIENRLKQVEAVMQEIQSEVVKKISEYGESIKSISKEIQETQQSFAKVINPILDKKRGLSKPSEIKEEEIPSEKQIPKEQQTPQENSEKPAKKPIEKPGKPTPKISSSGNSPSFEDYFR